LTFEDYAAAIPLAVM